MTRKLILTDASANLVTNPRFDDWTAGAPDGWTLSGTVSTTQSTSYPVSGAYSLKIDNPSGVNGSYYQDITEGIIGGQDYYIIVHARRTSGVARVIVYDGGGFNPVTYTWNDSSTYHVIKKTAPASGGIRIGFSVQQGTTAYYGLVQFATGYTEFIEGVQDTTFRTTQWNPDVAKLKGGGVWVDSPLSDGRALAYARRNNAIETIRFSARGLVGTDDADDVASRFIDLFALGEKARAFRPDGPQRDPVYLVAQLEGETNLRYAIARDVQMANVPDMVGIEWKQLTAKDITLSVERGDWLSLPPGEGVAVPAGWTQSYNSHLYGITDSGATAISPTVNPVPVGASYRASNITHVYNYDASAGTYSGGAVSGLSFPFTLFPASTAVGDIVYFGVNSSLSNSGPFMSLVMELSTAAAGTRTTQLEIYSAGTWAAVGGTSTTALGTTGTNIIDFAPTFTPSASITTTINGVTGFWARIRVTALTGALTRPILSIAPYTASQPYIDIANDEITGGDLPALIKYTIDFSESVGSRKLMLGARALNRGSAFNAYINAADEQTPSGITCSVSNGLGTFVEDQLAPAGRAVQWVPGSTGGPNEIYRMTFTQAAAETYDGRYRAFMFANSNGDTSTFTVQLRVFDDTVANQYSEFSVVQGGGGGGIGGIMQFDLGEISISPGYASMYIQVAAKVDDTTDTIKFYELILLPIDEWVGYAEVPSDSESATIDGVSVSNRPRPFVERYSTRPQLPPRKDMRIWTFHPILDEDVGVVPAFYTSRIVTLQVAQAGRYSLMRGAR